MKFEANWKSNSLDSLEKTEWGKPTYDSNLATTVHRLRKVPLNEYEIEDLRIMISQNIGLKFLIPIAIEQLSENLFVEGDLYAGDLLQAVLNSNYEFWKSNYEFWNQINDLINNKAAELENEKIKYQDFQNLKIDS